MSSARYFIVGGAGFIGSHFTDRLLCDNTTAGVTLYDNFSSGREWHYEHHKNDAQAARGARRREGSRGVDSRNRRA